MCRHMESINDIPTMTEDRMKVAKGIQMSRIDLRFLTCVKGINHESFTEDPSYLETEDKKFVLRLIGCEAPLKTSS